MTFQTESAYSRSSYSTPILLLKPHLALLTSNREKRRLWKLVWFEIRKWCSYSISYSYSDLKPSTVSALHRTSHATKLQQISYLLLLLRKRSRDVALKSSSFHRQLYSSALQYSWTWRQGNIGQWWNHSKNPVKFVLFGEFQSFIVVHVVHCQRQQRKQLCSAVDFLSIRALSWFQMLSSKF